MSTIETDVEYTPVPPVGPGVVTLSENAQTILAKRYLKRDDNGDVCETAEYMFWRVAKTIANVDASYGAHDEEVKKLALAFYEIMATGKWLPNSPTLMNAGRPLGQLSACFVLPVADALTNGQDGIYDTLTHMAKIHQSGGGTGFAFSNLRPSGSIVKSTTGVASGPVSFMSLYDASTDVVKQGGTRRGANMGILRVDHPDILEFIDCKKDTTKIMNFNISVAVTDAFMDAVQKDEEYDLHYNSKHYGALRAREVWNRICQNAHASGEPGLFFIDEANRHNPVPRLGDYDATNPCGEQPLLPYDVCNLGSINLGHRDFFIDEGPGIERTKPDWPEIERVQRLAVHFLDNVIDANQYPIQQIRDRSNQIRRIGAGVMGWADFLIRMGIPYDSEQAIQKADDVSDILHMVAHLESKRLAEERGPFPAWAESIWGPDETCARDAYGDRIRPERLLRNCNVDTVAPTGTISILANCSSGIEPIFAAAYQRNQADEIMYEVHPKLTLHLALNRNGDSTDIIKQIAETGHLPDSLSAEIRNVLRTAHDISPTAHIDMQIAWQKNIDSAISKTINFPREATVEDVEEGYLHAYRNKAKGVTAYRDGSRDNQVLSTGKTITDSLPEHLDSNSFTHSYPIKKADRPEVLHGQTRQLLSSLGTMYVTINELDKKPFEVFVALGKAGGAITADAEALGRLISLGLRHGVPMQAVYAQLRGISSDMASGFGPNKVYSIPDGVAQLIGKYLEDCGHESLEAHPNGVDDALRISPCPECGLPLSYEEGCFVCHACGHSGCS